MTFCYESLIFCHVAVDMEALFTKKFRKMNCSQTNQKFIQRFKNIEQFRYSKIFEFGKLQPCYTIVNIHIEERKSCFMLKMQYVRIAHSLSVSLRVRMFSTKQLFATSGNSH